ncbi:MAG: penicillin acylase family protein [Phycisphaerales bacterium JB058]
MIQTAWESAKNSYEKIPSGDRPWGRTGGLSITHVLGIPEFSHSGLETGGNGNTINATTKTNGPSWRMIVELAADSVTGHVIYPGGQSGNPGSPYYDNFIEDWLDGKYYKVNLEPNPELLFQTMRSSIHLIPK